MAKRVFTLPIYSALNTRAPWLVSMSDHADDPEFSFRLGPMRKTAKGFESPSITEDVFEVRRRVFGIRSPEDAMELFKEFGPWRLAKDLDKEGISVRFSAVLRGRDFFENALLHRSVENLNRVYQGPDIGEGLENIYLWHHLPMQLVFGDPPAAQVACKDIEDALRASVFLDRLDGFAWRRCQREDCGALYKLTSKRAKLYCSSDCAHHQAVRDYHKRMKSAKVLKAAKPAAKKGGR